MCIIAKYTYSCGCPCFEQRQWVRCPHLVYKERQPELLTPCPDLRRTFWRVFRWCTLCTMRARREGREVPSPAQGNLRSKVSEKLREQYWRNGTWVEVKIDDTSEENEPMERDLMLATLDQAYSPREDSPPLRTRTRNPPKKYRNMNIDELRKRFEMSSEHYQDRGRSRRHPSDGEELRPAKRVRILSPETGEMSSPGVDRSDPAFNDSALGSDMIEMPEKAGSESEESEEL